MYSFASLKNPAEIYIYIDIVNKTVTRQGCETESTTHIHVSLHSTPSCLLANIPLCRVLAVLNQQQISSDARPSHVWSYSATCLTDAATQRKAPLDGRAPGRRADVAGLHLAV